MRCKLLKIICFSIVMTTGFCGLILNTTPTHAANKCESCKCLRFEVTKKQNSSGKTNSEDSKDKTKWYCAKVNESGIITSEKLIDLVDSEDGDYYANGKIRYQQDTKDSKPAATFTFRNSNQGSSRASYTSTRQTKDNKWSTFFGNVKSDLNGKSISDTPYRYTISNIYETSTDDKGNATSIAEDDDPEDQEGQYADEAGGGGDEVTCYSDAAALGWVICPILQYSSDALGSIYEKIIEPFLQIETDLIGSSEDRNGTFQAWTTFQTIANVVFIIFFLIVIFSQVTGVGINNYGIKKALPKIIVAAILINISFILCQLLVDISNILGVGLKNLFDSFANNIDIPASKDSSLLSGVEFAGSGMLSALVVVLTGVAVWKLHLGYVLILPLLLGLLTAVIGILFFFILLSLRKAGVVILIAISPVAFICYALPNTKRFFDKWLKIFIALLMLYPLSGILIGGGNFASKILIAANPNGDFFYLLIAMLISVIPFFFIPSLLKSSFSALGSIGNKISGYGDKLKGSARSGIKSSDTFRNAQASLGYKRASKQLDRLKAKQEAGKLGKLGQMNAAHYLAQKGSYEKQYGNINVASALAEQSEQKKKAAVAAAEAEYKQALGATGRQNGARLFSEARKAQDEYHARAAANLAGNQKFVANSFNKELSRLSSEDDKKFLQSDNAQSVFKQMTQGENSKTFRASSPAAFQYASNSIKDQQGKLENGSTIVQTQDDFYMGTEGLSNFNKMMDNHVTDGSAVYAMSGGALEDMNKYLQSYSGSISEEDLEKYQKLFSGAEGYARVNGGYDNSKDAAIAEIQNTLKGLSNSGSRIDIPRNDGGLAGADGLGE